MTAGLFEDILAALPPGSKVKSINTFGHPHWASGFRLAIELDGKVDEYFVKISEHDDSADIARGEFESTKALAAALPGTVAAPTAWGTFTENPAHAFLVVPRRELKPYAAIPHAELLSLLKTLHAVPSPNGKFGFGVDTFYGPQRQPLTGWSASWEETYARLFRAYTSWARGALAAQGCEDDAELFGELARGVEEKVIPRLLRPLQSGGRSITPVLCHGDLYDLNVRKDADTGRMALFDPCALYGHAEVDLRLMWKPFGGSLRGEFVREYAAQVGVSEPKADFEDRCALYAIQARVVSAALDRSVAKELGLDERQNEIRAAKDEMRRLIAKFPDGIDGFEEASE